MIVGHPRWAQHNDFTVAQLLDALLEIIAVEEGLVFEAVPHVVKQVSVEAVGPDRAEHVADDPRSPVTAEVDEDELGTRDA